MSDDTETFGERLIRLRTAAGYATASSLARAIYGTKADGTARNRDNIWRYETNRSDPSKKNLAVLARFLHVTPQQLFPGRADPPPRVPKVGYVLRADGLADLDINVLVPVDLAKRIVVMVMKADRSTL